MAIEFVEMCLLSACIIHLIIEYMLLPVLM